MQVQYDTQLIEPAPIRADDLESQLRLSLDNYAIGQTTLGSISHILACPIGSLIAVHSMKSNHITLIDTRGQSKRVDKFALKACDKKFSRLSFSPTGLAFSPDGSRLAVGQSDCIIYIYRLPSSTTGSNTTTGQSLAGVSSGSSIQAANSAHLYIQHQQTDKVPRQSMNTSSTMASNAPNQPSSSNAKPVITGKFVCNSTVTCLVWSESGIIFGSQDGKIKIISMISRVIPSDTQRSSGIASLSHTLTASTNIPAQLSHNVSPNTSGLSSSTTHTGSSTSALNPSTINSSSSTTKVATIYSPSRYVTPISLAYRLPYVIIGYIDSSIHLITLSEDLISFEYQQNSHVGDTISNSASGNNRKLSTCSSQSLQTFDHSCPVHKITMLSGNMFCCGGCDGRLSFYTHPSPGSPARKASANSQVWSQCIELKEEIVGLDYSSTNEVLVVATLTCILFAKYNQDSLTWNVQSSHIELQNSSLSLAGFSCVSWTRDGSQLIAGTIRGSLELFRCSWTKQSIGDQLDICHIANNRIRITDLARNLLATYKTRHVIKRINMLDRNKSVIIWTNNSLLLARLDQAGYSEINWKRDREAKFYFSPSSRFVFVYDIVSSELQLIRIGLEQAIWTHKLDRNLAKKSLLSVQEFPEAQDEADAGESSEVNSEIWASPSRLGLFAYLEGEKSLVVVNLDDRRRQVELKHDNPIIWLGLSSSARYLAFRDLGNLLILLDLAPGHDFSIKASKDLRKQEECSFSTWMNGSDILLIQSGHRIVVVYDPEDWLRENPRRKGTNELRPTSWVCFDTRSFNVAKRAPIVDLSLARRAHPEVITIDGYHLILSNGVRVGLNPSWVKFFTQLSRGRLKSALAVLEAAEGEFEQSFWIKLGWLAIKSHNCKVASKVFARLAYASLAGYLEACMLEESNLRRQVKLFKLRGDWASFEQVADAEEIMSTYKRLNKWSRLIDYLNEAQKFKQRDSAEEERQNWLVSKGRLAEAATLRVSCNGDLVGALKLLNLDGSDELAAESSSRRPWGRIKQVAELLLSEPSRRQLALLSASEREHVLAAGRSVKRILLDEQQFELAAEISLKVLAIQEESQRNEALELYLRANSFERALELARQDPQIAPERLSQIQAGYAQHLVDTFKAHRVSRRDACKAVQLYQSAGDPLRALESALVLNYLELAQEQLRCAAENSTAPSGELSHLAGLVADRWLSRNNHEWAIEALNLGNLHARLVDLLVKDKNYEAALEVSIKSIHNHDREMAVKAFKQLAARLEDEDSQAAQSIYLLINEPDSAIQMHRRRGSEERLLELVEQHQPDRLESELLALARDREMAGDLISAEQLMMRIGKTEWTNVVRMYRLANRWSDAFRVAKENCTSTRDPILIQLAYFWSKSMSNAQEAADLLHQLGLLAEVLEFCRENNAINFALALCDHIRADEETKELAEFRHELIKKCAAQLERESKLDDAETLLIRFGLIQDAAEMYLDNEKFEKAIKLIESQLVVQSDGVSAEASKKSSLQELLNRTLVKAANQMIANETHTSINHELLNSAQQMYLRAMRPELAVQMYKERRMWRDAAAVAQRFAPHLLEDIERTLDIQISSEVDDIMSESKSIAISNGFSINAKTLSNSQKAEIDPSDESENMAKLRRQLGDQELLNDSLLTLLRRCEGKFSWGGDDSASGRDWLQLREALFRIWIGTDRSDSSFEHWLWLAHFASLHECLANQLLPNSKPSIELFEDLSRKHEGRQDKGLCLQLAADIALWLACQDSLLQARKSLFVAGLWQLGADRRSLAQCIWSHMLELPEADGERVGHVEAEQGEVRAWLLRRLIESPHGTDYEWNQVRLEYSWSLGGASMCMLCGARAESGAERPLTRLAVRSGRVFGAHQDELELVGELPSGRGRRRLGDRQRLSAQTAVMPKEINDFLLKLRTASGDG